VAGAFVDYDDNAPGTTSQSSIALSANYTPAAGNLIIIAVSYFRGTQATVNMPSAWGTFIQGGHFYNGADGAGVRWGIYENVSATASDANVTFSGGDVDFPGIQVEEFSGLLTASALVANPTGVRQAAPGTGAGAITVSATPGSAPAIVWGLSYCIGSADNWDTAVSDTGRPRIWPYGGATFFGKPQDAGVISTDAKALTWTTNNGDEIYYSIAMALAEAAEEGNVTLDVDAGAITVAGQSVTTAHTAALTGGAISIAGSDVTLNAGADTALSVEAGAISIAGQSVTANLTEAVGAGAVEVAGQSVTLDRTAVLSAGAITVAGQDQLFEYAVPWDAGVVTVAGQSIAAELTQALTGGAISIGGQDVALDAGENVSLPVTAGSISIAGQSLALQITASVSAGAVSHAGQSLSTLRQMAVTAGAVSISGQDVALSATGETSLPVTGGTITVSGQSMGFGISSPLTAGATAITGQAIAFTYTADLLSGSIQIAGQLITLIDSGALPPQSVLGLTATVTQVGKKATLQ
jgi:hypothetical protein